MDKFRVPLLSLCMSDGAAIHYENECVTFESAFRKGEVYSYKLPIPCTVNTIGDPAKLTDYLLSMIGTEIITQTAVVRRSWDLGPCSRPTIKHLSDDIQIDSAQPDPEKAAPKLRYQWVRLFTSNGNATLRTTMIRVMNMHRVRLRAVGSESESANLGYIFPIPDTAYLVKTMYS